MEHQEPFFPLKGMLLAILRYNLPTAQGKNHCSELYQLQRRGTLRC